MNSSVTSSVYSVPSVVNRILYSSCLRGEGVFSELCVGDVLDFDDTVFVFGGVGFLLGFGGIGGGVFVFFGGAGGVVGHVPGQAPFDVGFVEAAIDEAFFHVGHVAGAVEDA